MEQRKYVRLRLPVDPQLKNCLLYTSVPADAVLEEKIGTAQIADARIRLQKYKSGKTALENRIVENEKWWRLRHNRPKDDNSIEATSGWLFNCIISKHADAMDS